MKPTLTRTYSQDFTLDDKRTSRIALTLNAWLPNALVPSEAELRDALTTAHAGLTRMMLEIDPPVPAKPACKDCRFYQLHGSQKGGVCRRNPPTEDGFPGAGLGDWCGEFSQKAPTP